MEYETIIAAYETVEAADAVARDLKAAGIPANGIGRHVKGAASASTRAESQGAFWTGLLGSKTDERILGSERGLPSQMRWYPGRQSQQASSPPRPWMSKVATFLKVCDVPRPVSQSVQRPSGRLAMASYRAAPRGRAAIR